MRAIPVVLHAVQPPDRSDGTAPAKASGTLVAECRHCLTSSAPSSSSTCLNTQITPVNATLGRESLRAQLHRALRE